MNNHLPLLAVLAIALYFATSAAYAQGSQHTPLKGITVRLQSFTAPGKVDSLDASNSKLPGFEREVTTDDDGEFMFGYVPSGTYALGCSYTSCYVASRKSKRPGNTDDPPEKDSVSPEEPLMQISVNECEGVVCRVAIKNMTPDGWPSSTKTTITKDWSNTIEWLKSGGGLTLRVDGAHSIISGKIEEQ